MDGLGGRHQGLVLDSKKVAYYNESSILRHMGSRLRVMEKVVVEGGAGMGGGR